jgi:nitroreductase
MKVSEALASRITCRAFLTRPVPAPVIRSILEAAKRAPSGGNLQPWQVWVVTGGELVRLKQAVKEKLAAGQMGDGPTEYQIYPPNLKEPFKSRRFKCGEDMYATIGVARENKAGRMVQFARNFEFFGAPAAMFFAIDRSMQQGQWSDLGMFILAIMLMAREHGLHSAGQEAWAIWHKTVGEFVRIPPESMLFCGLSIGYMDEDHPINGLRTDRAPLEEFVTFHGE